MVRGFPMVKYSAMAEKELELILDPRALTPGKRKLLFSLIAEYHEFELHAVLADVKGWIAEVDERFAACRRTQTG